MPLSRFESNTVSRGLLVAKKLLDEVKPQLDSLGSIYDSVGGASATITQLGLDEVPSFSAITKDQLDAGMYAMTIMVKGAIDSAYAALVQLAARA